MHTTKQYPEAIHAIHQDFFAASEKLLKEAEQFPSLDQIPSAEKLKRLSAAGFKFTQDSSTNLRVKRGSGGKVTRKLLEKIQEYAIKYPNSKFITEGDVKAICKKYNLVIGDLDDYSGFVPEKNLTDLEKFKFYVEDLVEVEVITGNKWSGTDENREWVNIYGWRLRLTPQIIAPLNQFSELAQSQAEGYEIKSTPKDPIVVQRVKRGYLIITAWGDEAADPIVQNPRNN